MRGNRIQRPDLAAQGLQALRKNENTASCAKPSRVADLPSSLPTTGSNRRKNGRRRWPLPNRSAPEHLR